MADIISTTFDQLNLDDPFFDSLKSMYRNFSTWFRNKAEEHASCDVVYDAEGNLKAMLYTKIEGKYEDYSRMEKPFAPSFRLKIGTLKSELRGEGIGKRFLEMAVERARQDPGISDQGSCLHQHDHPCQGRDGQDGQDHHPVGRLDAFQTDPGSILPHTGFGSLRII